MMENTRTLSTQMDCWSPGAAPAQTTLDEALWVARGRYAAFGVSWEIQTDDVSAYHLLLDRLPPGSTAASSKVTARSYSFRTLPPSVSETEASYLLEADGRPLVRSSDPDEIAEAFEEDVKWLVAGRSPRRVFLRAGVVGWRDRVIVIPGGPRSGKSTLVRALVGCGATYFSDEYAVLEGHTVGPYPSRVVNWSAPRVSLGAWVDDGTALQANSLAGAGRAHGGESQLASLPMSAACAGGSPWTRTTWRSLPWSRTASANSSRSFWSAWAEKPLSTVDFGGQAAHDPEDLDLALALDDAAAEGVLGLEADDEDGVAPILHAFAQVVQDAARFAHAAGGDDDARAGLGGDGFRFFLVRDVVKALELEGRIAADQAGVGLFVVALGVHLEDVGQLHRQRRIHVHRYRRHLLGGAQPLERVDHLLRAFEGEGGNEDLAAARTVRLMASARALSTSSMGEWRRSP
jgi:hypothetical protein